MERSTQSRKLPLSRPVNELFHDNAIPMNEHAMNAISLNARTPANQSMLRRFLWKEYRMLRGFWLAVAALAILAQSITLLFGMKQELVPGYVFVTAWGAAALYAVGCTITLFSAEREEGTHDFLQLLPINWWSMFAGKVLLAIGSAIALALVLSLTGWLIASGTLPRATMVREVLSIAGVAIIEATAWGLLFSLLMRQPLLAAIVSMAIASFAAQLAVAATAPASQAFVAAAYVQAVPMRLLICLGVFVVDVWLASRWLRPAAESAAGRFRQQCSELSSLRFRQNVSSATTRVNAESLRASRRRMLVRLLWQTWRESWKTMLTAVPISVLLMVNLAVAGWLANAEQLTVFLGPLILPALFGALVFRADQRDGHRQFLVAHAGRPRYVWLARQLVWLSALIVIGLAVQLVATALSVYGLSEHLRFALSYQYFANGYLHSAWTTAWQSYEIAATVGEISALVWCAWLAAYGLGQLCSMMLRREVLAGFLSLLLAALLTVWTVTVGLWQLNPLWFVLPLAIGSTAATWLRAPDWMLGRTTVRSWAKPFVAIALAIAGMLIVLPASRTEQLPDFTPTGIYDFSPVSPSRSFADWQAEAPAARKTSAEYEQLQAMLVPWDEATQEVRIDGKQITDLDFLGIDGNYGGLANEFGGFDREGFSAEEREQLDEFELARRHQYAAANQALIERLQTLSEQPDLVIPESAFDWHNSYWSGIHGSYENLLINDASRLVAVGELPEALNRYAAAVRLRGRLLARRNTRRVLATLNWRAEKKDLEAAILQWAQHPEQTSKNIKAAIAELASIYRDFPDPREAVLADYAWVREILLDKRSPTFLQQEEPRMVEYLPYLAHQLPWEYDRALRALEILVAQNLNYVDAVSAVLRRGQILRQQGRPIMQHRLSELLSPVYNDDYTHRHEVLSQGNWDHFVLMQELSSSCRSSFLVADELRRRGELANYLLHWIDLQIAQRGLLTQLALIAHQLDHQAYPELLEELVPEYLSTLPIDPYSRLPFEYRPNGLELSLQPNSNNPNNYDRETAIAAGTPLLWSTGVAGYGLEQKIADLDSEGAGWRNAQEGFADVAYYAFRPSNFHVWHRQPYVATLPTSDTAE